MATVPDFRQIALEASVEDIPRLRGAIAEADSILLERLVTEAAGNGHGSAATVAEQEFLTYEEAAKFLRVSASYVETLVAQGKLVAVKLPATDKAGRPRSARLVRLRVADLRALAEEYRA